METADRKSRPIDALLILRAFAAFAVLVFHVQTYWDEGGSGARLDWLVPRHGYPPVLLFFGLSGYLITKTFATGRYDLRSAAGFLDYYRNRLLRIFPLYWFNLAVCALVFLPRTLAEPWRVVGLLTFTESYRNPGLLVFNPPYWTIPIEVFFYALAPFLYFAMRACVRRLGWPGVAVAVIAFYQAYSLWLFHGFPMQDGSIAIPRSQWNATAHHSFFYNLQAFLLGALANFSVELSSGTAWARRRGFRGVLWVVFLVGLAAMNFEAGSSVRELRGQASMSRFFLFGLVPSAGLLVALLAWLQDTRVEDASRYLPFRRVFVGLEWVGLFSYGIYLWNWPILTVLVGAQRNGYLPVGPLTLTLLTACITLALAGLTYFYVERPFLRLRTRMLELERAVTDHDPHS